MQERTKNAQFIIISLRNNMFEVGKKVMSACFPAFMISPQLADRLVGIYKTDNCTKSITINPALVAGLLQNSAILLIEISTSCRSSGSADSSGTGCIVSKQQRPCGIQSRATHHKRRRPCRRQSVSTPLLCPFSCIVSTIQLMTLVQ